MNDDYRQPLFFRYPPGSKSCPIPSFGEFYTSESLTPDFLDMAEYLARWALEQGFGVSDGELVRIYEDWDKKEVPAKDAVLLALAGRTFRQFRRQVTGIQMLWDLISMAKQHMGGDE